MIPTIIISPHETGVGKVVLSLWIGKKSRNFFANKETEAHVFSQAFQEQWPEFMPSDCFISEITCFGSRD